MSRSLLLVNAPMLGVRELKRANASAHLQLIYSYLQNHGVGVDVYDATEELGLPEDSVEAYLEKLACALDRFRFDVGAVSCGTSFQYSGAVAVGRLLRRQAPDAPLVVGGCHPTFLPEDFHAAGSPFDYVVQGAGEKMLLELATAPTRPTETQLLSGEAAPLESVVNDWSYPYAAGSLFFSRGCPFSCLYCIERGAYSDCCSVDHAVSELGRAFEHAENGRLYVMDACFGVRPQWRREFLRRVAALDTSVGLQVEVRADQLEAEDIPLLAQARCNITFGVESGSPKMLGIMRKTNNPARYLSRLVDVLRACDEHGVPYQVGVLYNHPGESRATLEESTEFFWRSFWDGPSQALTSFHIHTYAYLPGSPLDELLPEFAERYGTRIHHPTWWRDPEPEHRDKAESNTASSDLSLQEAHRVIQQLRVANWMVTARKRAVTAGR